MKIQIESDLHLEHFGADWRQWLPAPAPGADACVFAGDIHSGELSVQAAVEFAQRHGVPVVWVAGNHEFYGRDIDELLRLFENSAENARSHGVLMVETLGPTEVCGHMFCGSTLWTDCALYEGSARLPTVMDAATEIELRINDFRLIRENGMPFRALSMRERHMKSLQKLSSELSLSKESGLPVVAVTHHLPLLECVDVRFSSGSRALESKSRLPAENPWWTANPAFASRCDKEVALADLWIHGHTHCKVDLEHSGCRVMANPRGYGRILFGEIVMENGDYSPAASFDTAALRTRPPAPRP